MDTVLPGVSEAESNDPFPRFWTRKEYHRACELGLFGPEERLELIEGEILTQVTPQDTPHATGVRLVTIALEAVFGAGFEIRAQLPITIEERSEPEPDIVVASGDPRDYEEHHPHPEEILLLVEVSDRTLAFDRGRKARLYARADIREYWLLNLPQRQFEIHRQPKAAGSWGSITFHTENERVTPIMAPGSTVIVSDLLPRLR